MTDERLPVGAPRYINVGTSHTAMNKRSDGLEEVIREIEELVGLGSVKQELNRLMAFARVIALRRERDIPVGAINLHMVFAGPPGTGKTVVARMVGRILKAIGLLRKGHYIEADRSQLVASYVGQTAIQVTEKVKDALGGVLFIDEAYTLSGGGGALATADSFGQEAIDTLLKLMEDYREQLVVIAAGYTSEMRRFIESNPGLKSRFSRYIEFPSYSGEELFAIFQMLVRKGHYRMTTAAEHEARKHIEWLSKTADEHFGNARTIRSFFEHILPAQAERVAQAPNLEELTDDELLRIEVDDVRAAIEAGQ